MEEAIGPMMLRIARVCLIQTLPWPTGIEAPCAKIFNRADRAHKRRLAAPRRNPEPSEWAIGTFPRVRPAGTVALSAAFGRAARRGCRATMDIRASGPPGAEASRAEEDSAEVVVVATVAAAMVADIDRSKGNHGEN